MEAGHERLPCQSVRHFCQKQQENQRLDVKFHFIHTKAQMPSISAFALTYQRLLCYKMTLIEKYQDRL
jgi:hypothetical protein